MRYYADHPDMNEPSDLPKCKCSIWPIVDTTQETLNGNLYYDLCFFVEGPARAKQSFRYGRNGHSFQSARVKGWQADVGWAAQQAIRQPVNHLANLGRFPLHGTIAVELIFFLEPAKSSGKTRRIDLDNLSKGVLDGLNGIVWDDDQQIVDLHIRKVTDGPNDRPGVNVMIKELKP